MVLTITTLAKAPEYLMQAVALWNSVESRLWLPEPGYMFRKLFPCTLPSISSTALIVLEGSTVIGLVVLQPTADIATPPGPWLSYLVVHPLFRSLGIGRILIEEVRSLCIQRSVPSLYLFTASETLPRYYAGLGWEPFQHITFRGLPALIMKHTLKDG